MILIPYLLLKGLVPGEQPYNDSFCKDHRGLVPGTRTIPNVCVCVDLKSFAVIQCNMFLHYSTDLTLFSGCSSEWHF